MRTRRLVYLASALAIASAAVSLFWTLGGTLLLDTVGGSFEKLARTRSPLALALGTATSLAKIGAALLSLAVVRPWGRRVPDRVLVGANVFVSVVLVTWGSANVVAGTLALTGVVSSADGLNEHALQWHVFIWDLWFLVWGIALALALLGVRSANRTIVGRRQRRRARSAPPHHDVAQLGSPEAGDERRHPFRLHLRRGTLEVDSTKEKQ